jgi:hypothetical protein
MEEIYKERYETYRHLDKLRWQMLQIAVAAGSAVFAFGDGDSSPRWWTWLLVGLVFSILGAAMLRIGHGIKANSKMLCEAGKAIGDPDVPIPAENLHSVSFWIAMSLTLSGVVCVLTALYICQC